MQFTYQGRWLLLVIELFPPLIEIRPYRVSSARLECRTHRRLQRHLAQELDRSTPEDK